MANLGDRFFTTTGADASGHSTRKKTSTGNHFLDNTKTSLNFLCSTGAKIWYQHFYFSHRPSPLLRGRRLSGSWRGSSLSRFLVGFSHFWAELTKNRPKVDLLQGVRSECVVYAGWRSVAEIQVSNSVTFLPFSAVLAILDERQITHLICARLKYDLYDFFRGCFGAFYTRERAGSRPKTALKSHIDHILGGHRLDE